MKNFKRLDYSPFTLFIDTYSQPKSSNTHQHEDALSYVMYKNTRPVLVDSGRASYNVKDKYLDPSYHSGFSDPHWPVRPNPRFFFCKQLLTQEKIAEYTLDNGVSFMATNRLLHITKHLTFLFENNTLSITERLETKRTIQGRLFHIFADCSVEQSSDNTIMHTSTRTKLTYKNAASIHIETIQRAIDYGKTTPCHRVIVLPNYSLDSIFWSAEHAY